MTCIITLMLRQYELGETDLSLLFHGEQPFIMEQTPSGSTWSNLDKIHGGNHTEKELSNGPYRSLRSSHQGTACSLREGREWEIKPPCCPAEHGDSQLSTGTDSRLFWRAVG